MANHLFFRVENSTNHSNNIIVEFVDWLSHELQTLANQWHSNYSINKISSNILSLGSFFSQHQLLDTLWGQLYYALTPYSRFLKENKLIWEEPLCSGHLSITDTILRSRWCPLFREFTVLRHAHAESLALFSNFFKNRSLILYHNATTSEKWYSMIHLDFKE